MIINYRMYFSLLLAAGCTFAGQSEKKVDKSQTQGLVSSCSKNKNYLSCSRLIDMGMEQRNFNIVSVASRRACIDHQKDCKVARLYHQARILSNWSSTTQKNTNEFRQVENAKLALDYLDIESRESRGALKATVYKLSDREQAKIHKTLTGLPKCARSLVERDLYGIVVLDGMDASGGMIELLDENLNPKKFILVLNSKILDMGFGTWVQMRENTALDFDKNASFEIRIKDANSIGAIHYLLLHEIGHWLGFLSKLVPSEWLHISEVHVNELPFLIGSWEVKELSWYAKGIHKGKPDFYFPRFYWRNQIKPAATAEVYARLFTSPFVTLYSAMNPNEDFAETFAFYQLEQYMGSRATMLFHKEPTHLLRQTSGPGVVEIEKKQKLISKACGQLFE